MPDSNEPPDLEKSRQRCPACNGIGRFALLTGVHPCDHCGGGGRIEPVCAEGLGGACYRPHVIYDKKGRVIFEAGT